MDFNLIICNNILYYYTMKTLTSNKDIKDFKLYFSLCWFVQEAETLNPHYFKTYLVIVANTLTQFSFTNLK